VTRIARAVIVGMAILLAGTIPRNALFAANLRFGPQVPWSVLLVAVYLWFFWRYLRGEGPPKETAEERRRSLRSNRLPVSVWRWALMAGGLGIVALVLALRVANRLVVLPPQELPDFGQVPRSTIVVLLFAAAPVAGIVEESAFRGYMQRPIELEWGLVPAILLSGTMFAVAHLDFTLVLWPYYIAVSAIYGTVTYLTQSIQPAIVLHTAGNTYSNLDLWLHGHAEWQAPSGGAEMIWNLGPDRPFVLTGAALVVVSVVMIWSYTRLGHAAGRHHR
jgi:membrane protease YdiL (CAAX protease family)